MTRRLENLLSGVVCELHPVPFCSLALVEKKKVNCRFFICFILFLVLFVVVVDLAQVVGVMVLSLAALSGCSARIPVYTAQGPG